MSAILFATRSLPNALNKEIVGDLSHVARCRSALGVGSVEIGGCDVMSRANPVARTNPSPAGPTDTAGSAEAGTPPEQVNYPFKVKTLVLSPRAFESPWSSSAD
ncbi:hypothetical protein Bbelb_068400 [Branchiostoma belcheri]|nr:hypothetical protein Bbelb_068400 [Branchiostoma belcheri]